MSARRHVTDVARWTVCFALVSGAHVAGAAALFGQWRGDHDPLTAAPVMTVELAPLPAAPPRPPTNAAPGPSQADAPAAPQPERPPANTEIAPSPAKDAELSPLPPPKPPDKPHARRPRRLANVASAPVDAETKAARPAAQAPGAAAHDPSALPNWKSALVARLERYKRYPSEARGEQGVAQLAFTVDRGGGVHHAHIARSSGSAALDRATLALIARAQPLPAPPPEIKGAEIAITVPVRYSVP